MFKAAKQILEITPLDALSYILLLGDGEIFLSYAYKMLHVAWTNSIWRNTKLNKYILWIEPSERFSYKLNLWILGFIYKYLIFVCYRLSDISQIMQIPISHISLDSRVNISVNISTLLTST